MASAKGIRKETDRIFPVSFTGHDPENGEQINMYAPELSRVISKEAIQIPGIRKETDRIFPVSVNGEQIDTYAPEHSRVISKETIQIPGGRMFNTCELQNVLSMTELGTISVALGRNWRFLGHELDLKESEIYRCEDSHPNNPERQIFEMLKVWKTSKLENAKMVVLLKGLRKHKGTVDWEKIEEVVYEHIQMRRRESC